MRKFFASSFLFLTFYIFAYSQNERTIINITDQLVTVDNYVDKEIIISGKCDLHLTSATQPLSNSIVRLMTEDSWLFIDNIRPSVVISTILSNVFVNDKAAVNKSNVRVAIYKHGTVIMAHAAGYKPLTVFSGQDFAGDSSKYSIFTKYTSLGALNNKIRSFKLKRGYMATFATSSDGTGYSRVYIADKGDLIMPVLPVELDKVISFIRSMSWEWVTKKGWCGTGSGGGQNAEQVKGTWFYSWSADQNSTSNLEYTPIRQNGGWPGWSEINGKQNVSHLLGFNEPDQTNQANMTVNQILAQWPDMLKTGLRIGSPAWANAGNTYPFMDSCKARNYRVDYVAVHAYWGGKTPQNWYNDLKYIHEKTGRPLWITEWNNGANWTTEWWPSDVASQQTKQLNEIKAILNVLDTAHFVERYSIYNWVEDKRAMIINGVLTPAGQYYTNNKSVMAFNRAAEVIPVFNFSVKPSLNLTFGTSTVSMTITDKLGEYFSGFVVEKKVNGGEYVEVFNSDNIILKNFTDSLNKDSGSKVRYRAKTKLSDGSLTAYSIETGYDISNGNEIQYGNVFISNIGWNPILYRIPYAVNPTIIVGSPTNKNISVLLTSRAKLVSASIRFNLQIAPWSYQKVSTLAKEEVVPYFVLAPGIYNFGGLEAQAGKSTVGSTWTAVTFSTPFQNDPLVFTTQQSSLSANASTVRVRRVTKTGFEARLQKESAITTPLSAESVSFFAITPGTGVIDNRKIIVGKTADNAIGSVYTTVNYGDSISDPIFIAQMQTCNDDTVTASLRTLFLSNKYANVIKQREKSTGVSTMSKETAGWFVIDPASIIDGIDSPKSPKMVFYPNPVKDFLYFNKKFSVVEKAEIYNIFGSLVKSVGINGNMIDVKDMVPGYYFIIIKGFGSGKFLKM